MDAINGVLGRDRLQTRRDAGELISCFEQFNAELRQEVDRRKAHLAHSGKFNGFIVLVILVNTIVIGVETDSVRTDDLQDGQKMAFFVVEGLFGFIFFAEMVLRINQLSWDYFVDPWNIFDYSLVVLSCSDIVATLSGQAGGMRLASSLRIFRLLRVVRSIKGLAIVQGLWMIIQGLLDSAKTMVWVAFALIILVYCFAVSMTTLTGHDPKTKEAWPDADVFMGSVLGSMLTVVQVITLDQWTSDVARPLLEIVPISFSVLMMAIVVLTFGTLNILVAVMVERVGQIAQDSKQTSQKILVQTETLLLQSILDDFHDADSQENGHLELKEFRKLIRGRSMSQKLSLLGVTPDEAESLFELMDVDKNGTVTPGEFISGLEKVKGNARGQDVVQLICFAQKQVLRATRFVAKVQALNDKVDEIQSRMNVIGKSLTIELSEKQASMVRTEKTFSSAAQRQLVIMQLDKNRMHNYPVTVKEPETP
eukprot:TRINITY_DN60738_c0_g1_i1.p1 TRINITY_DN60738_c0_g1~~TRINITY_DN60738_c0_g1_i1.p1  ORF type:complete len:487 (-),score=86.08 TRINITY_DN60738_c0_g1_i1:33-1472(-)